MQSPKVLKVNEVLFGISVVPSNRIKEIKKFGSILNNEHSLYGRTGIMKNIDGGVKFSGVPYFWKGGISGDIKFQLTENPVFMSFDIESSYYTIQTNTHGEFSAFDFIHIYSIHPLLLVGNEYVYFGAGIYFFSSFHNENIRSYNLISGITYPGKKLQPRIEVNTNLKFENRNFTFISFGIEYHYNDK
ncbi:MAG: hypothetical protein KGZ58_05150 [Ignavibacteriales bacterium]|nr:hypothetical protein [Ignavibacteriales bacterium]